MDILATMDIDTAIEYERDTASSDATIMMIQGLCKNSDITAKVRDNAIGDYRKRVDNMSKNNEKDFQSELAKIYGDISARNQVRNDTQYDTVSVMGTLSTVSLYFLIFFHILFYSLIVLFMLVTMHWTVCFY